MASTYSSNLKIELMGTGENSGTWGGITNTNLGTALEQAVIGYGNPDYLSDTNLTITITNSNASQAARCLVLNVTSAFGSLTATRELIVPTTQKQYIVQNNTTGGQSITVKTSAGTGITVPAGRKAHLYVDGTNVVQMFDFVDINGGTIDGATVGAASASTGAFTTLNASGATTLDGTVALGNAPGDLITVPGTIGSNLVFTDNLYDIGATGATRPRDLFLAGAATVGGNLSVGGTLTLTGGVNLNGNVTVGDTSADTLTINSTITSNLIFTDNTYDIGASGATRPRNLFLAGNATISGAQTLTGALTVDSTTDSSSTTTGSIQTDGGVGIAKALFVGTTANIAGAVTLSGGTANGVTYLNGSKVLTSGTALVFDGTSLGLGVTPSAWASGWKSQQVGTLSALADTGSVTYLGNNWYQNTSSNNIYLTSTYASLYGQTAGNHIWYTAPSGTAGNVITFTQAMTLDASGNLGIGTTSPATRLTVGTSTSAYAQQFRVGNATTDGFESIYNEAYSLASGGTGSQEFYADVEYRLYSGGVGVKTGVIAWHTAIGGTRAERMQIDSSGNLGIGTSSPAAKLDIIGPSAASSPYSSKAIQFAPSNFPTRTWSLNYDDGGASGNGFNISAASTKILYLNANGNVGIGTSSPTRTLSVNGNLGVGSGSVETIITDDASTGIIRTQTNHALVFGTNTLERARIDSSGNLLVNRTTTTTSLGGDTPVVFADGAFCAFVGSYNAQYSSDRINFNNGNYYVVNDLTVGVKLVNGATSWTTQSDERKKDIIEPITSAVDKVLTLRAVIGKYKTDEDGVRRSFLIAQDVQSALPEAVDSGDSEDLGVRYTEVIPLLVAAIKEQQALIVSLTARLDAANL